MGIIAGIGTSIGALGIIIGVVVAVVFGILWFLLPMYVSQMVKLLKSIDKRLAVIEAKATTTTTHEMLTCPDCNAKHPTSKFKHIGANKFECPSCLCALIMD